MLSARAVLPEVSPAYSQTKSRSTLWGERTCEHTPRPAGIASSTRFPFDGVPRDGSDARPRERLRRRRALDVPVIHADAFRALVEGALPRRPPLQRPLPLPPSIAVDAQSAIDLYFSEHVGTSSKPGILRGAGESLIRFRRSSHGLTSPSSTSCAPSL